MNIRRLVLVANPSPEHVGFHLLAAARELDLETELLDVRSAWSRSRWLNRLSHRLLRHRPARLAAFSRQVARVCQSFRPHALLVTGIAAPDARRLAAARRQGIVTVNFLTDDPWNPRNGAGFFWAALREYAVVCSPRRVNLDDLRRHGCQRVEYLPFGYNPAVHFPEPPAGEAERRRFAADVVIVGGADADRLPLARALARAGLRLRLYGGYWDRHADLRPFYGGFVQGRELRLAVGGGRVHVALVRRANRDGHAMRSLELPAMGACLVAEDTAEHRELYGGDGGCVEYFSNMEEMVAKTKALCREPERARAVGKKAFQRICRDHPHTYADRLARICQNAALALESGGGPPQSKKRPALTDDRRTARSVLECASPLALWERLWDRLERGLQAADESGGGPPQSKNARR